MTSVEYRAAADGSTQRMVPRSGWFLTEDGSTQRMVPRSELGFVWDVSDNERNRLVASIL